MIQPLALLKKRVNQDGLFGDLAEVLVKIAEQRYQELLQHEFPPNVILVDRDPLRFLASFIAACSAPCHVFLCNPDWGETEWQQVSKLVMPTLVWGDRTIPLSQCSSSPAIANLIMIPTGGTSGKIRFAMHTWETLTASVGGFRQYFEVDRVHSFCVLPLYHVSGLMQFMRSFLSNGTLMLQSWKSLDKLEVDPQDFFLSLVPTQLQSLIEVEQLSRFKTILLGGAPAWSALLDQARSRHLPIAPTYGMTETASQIATLKPIEFLNDVQGCGRVLPHAEITIDAQTSKLSIQAKSLMLGYYPEFSDSAFDPDDLGYFDDRGFLHILGRDSNKIITGGENVFSIEVETAIRATQLVRDVCVLGLPDSVWGQIVAAIYVPNHDEVSNEKLAEELRSQLSNFKQPKRWIKVSQIPRNAQGKINRDRILQALRIMN